jgi:hypothetical protein
VALARSRTLAIGAAVVGLLLFALYIWPTPWRDIPVQPGARSWALAARENRFTGQVEFLVTRWPRGWMPARGWPEQPRQQSVAPVAPVRDTTETLTQRMNRLRQQPPKDPLDAAWEAAQRRQANQERQEGRRRSYSPDNPFAPNSLRSASPRKP